MATSFQGKMLARHKEKQRVEVEDSHAREDDTRPGGVRTREHRRRSNDDCDLGFFAAATGLALGLFSDD